MQPRLLILDEPTEASSPIIKEIERAIRTLAASGEMAILLVEQYYDFARSLADQYLVMERGEIVARARAPTWNATASSACWRYDRRMQLADPLAQAWKAELRCASPPRRQDSAARAPLRGPLVVQKPLYPDGESTCHAIVVHPPGGIAGGDQLVLDARCEPAAHALLTTPGAGKWYRSAGAWAGQALSFDVEGTLEWLPRETIVFDAALCSLQATINLGEKASFIGWEVVCFGRGDGFRRGRLKMDTRVLRGGKPSSSRRRDRRRRSVA
jgi:hypothetical protein